MALRWGIVSAGKISNDFAWSLKTLPETDHQIVAVAARSLSSAKSFAENLGIPKYYEGYANLAKDKDIDIIYVGNLNPQHFEVSKLMLENGKHVLCEKPLTINEKQTRELISVARSKNLLLQEAIWSRSFPAYSELAKLLAAGTIGEVLYVNASFGFVLEEVERINSKALGGGTILDLGVYTLQFQQFIFRGLSPDNIQADGFLNKDGVDSSMSAIISYAGGKSATVSTSSRAMLPNEGIVIGTKGIIRVPDFWCPIEIITPQGTLKFDLPKTSGKLNFLKSVGLCYQAEHARQLIKTGKIESPNITHEESIQLAHLMDNLRKKIGVIFPEDA